MTRSLAAGERVRLEQVGLFADGVAVRQVGELTFALAQRHVDAMVTVDTDEICAAIKDVFEDTRSILEPAGALAVAGMKRDVAARGLRDRTLVAVACGANMNFDRLLLRGGAGRTGRGAGGPAGGGDPGIARQPAALLRSAGPAQPHGIQLSPGGSDAGPHLRGGADHRPG